MPSIGPSLPPHLAKQNSEERSSEQISKASTKGPIGPSLPPHLAKRKRSEEPEAQEPSRKPSLSPESSEKRRRILGPAPPPAPLSERPQDSASDNDSDSSDDDFGPAPPPVNGLAPGPSSYSNDEGHACQSAFDTDPKYKEEEGKIQRDDWMMLPPKADDLAARMDPTKIRARKFNSGPRASGGGGGGDMAVWTETPEQKRKRLENEVMGVTAPANSSSTSSHMDRARDKEAEATARRIREHTEKVRGRSLMEHHKEQGTGKDKEDDPSKRAFDREKDMGGGMKIGEKQRRELLNKAKDFGSRFSGGSFL